MTTDAKTKEALADILELAKKGLCFETSDSNHHSREDRLNRNIAYLTTIVDDYEKVKAELERLFCALLNVLPDKEKQHE